MLDPAVLRPGRFDRLVYVPAPDDKTRLQILKLYVKNMPLAKNVDIDEIASMIKGYSGADVQALCREAGMSALRRSINAKEVAREDFIDAVSKVGPSMTPDVEKFYEAFAQSFRRVERTVIPSPIA
jgi:transitional endoplasmic reticulum ATPase